MLIKKRKIVKHINKKGEQKIYKYLYYDTYDHKTNRRRIYLTKDEETDIIYANLTKNIAKYIIAKIYGISPARVRKIINNYIENNPEEMEEECPYFYEKPHIDIQLMKRVQYNYRNYNLSIKKLMYLYNLSRYMVHKICKVYEPW